MEQATPDTHPLYTYYYYYYWALQYRKERWYKYERWKHWLVVCTEGLLEG